MRRKKKSNMRIGRSIVGRTVRKRGALAIVQAPNNVISLRRRPREIDDD